jgi:hypothetical protein
VTRKDIEGWLKKARKAGKGILDWIRKNKPTIKAEVEVKVKIEVKGVFWVNPDFHDQGGGW